MTTKRILLFLTTLFTAEMNMSAQNAVQNDSSDHITLKETVVTAQYGARTEDKSVYKIKVINQEKIRNMGAQNLRDVLTNEMNVRLTQDNILGSSMSIQGISGQNVKILVDGIPVLGRLNGSIDISQINLNNAERIEIVEGPLSVSYGTDALAGTINVITKKCPLDIVAVSVKSYYESIGQYNFSGNVRYSKKRSSVMLSGGRNYFDGWKEGDKAFHVEKKSLADSSRYDSWKPKLQYFGTLALAQEIKKMKLTYTSDYFFEEVINLGLPRLPYRETAFDDYYKTNRLVNSLNLSGQLNGKYYLNAFAAHNYFQRNKNTYYKDLTTLEESLSKNEGEQDTSTFRAILSRASIASTKENAAMNFETGYDINSEIAKGLRIKNSRQEISDYAVFGSMELKPLANLIFRPGIRALYNTAYKAPLIPSLNIKYTLLPKDSTQNKTTAFCFSYARGFRAPSLKELYFFFVDINHNIVGNEDLKAENSHNFNGSITYHFSKGKNNFKIESSLFYNYIYNMISLAQDENSTYSYFNLENFQTLGLQLQGSLSGKNLSATAGGSYIGRYNQLSGISAGNKFLYSPEARLNISYKWIKPVLYFSFYYKYTGQLPSFSVNENNEIIKSKLYAYHMGDLSVTKKFLKKKISLTGGCKNIFNVRNVIGNNNSGAHTANSYTVSVGMGRTFFTQLEINLSSK